VYRKEGTRLPSLNAGTLPTAIYCVYCDGKTVSLQKPLKINVNLTYLEDFLVGILETIFTMAYSDAE
jgi:hypothetical protein